LDVLRVTMIGESDSPVTLKVEGEVTSLWSSVLESECLRYLRTHKNLVLDFSGVTRVDRHGAQILTKLQARHVRLMNCWSLLEDQIRDLSSDETM
jgi:anti-anti-sigma regulatory factor